jgi:hypothetical protein
VVAAVGRTLPLNASSARLQAPFRRRAKMKFRMVYEGRIGGQNTKEEEKQKLRSSFHPQLESLWSVQPLKEFREYRVQQG